MNFIVGLIVGSSLGLFFMALITVGREEDKMMNRQDELLSIDELIRDIFYDAGIVGSELQINKEKKDFFNSYIKNGFVVVPVEEDGKLVFRMTLNRK